MFWTGLRFTLPSKVKVQLKTDNLCCPRIGPAYIKDGDTYNESIAASVSYIITPSSGWTMWKRIHERVSFRHKNEYIQGGEEGEGQPVQT